MYSLTFNHRYENTLKLLLIISYTARREKLKKFTKTKKKWIQITLTRLSTQYYIPAATVTIIEKNFSNIYINFVITTPKTK